MKSLGIRYHVHCAQTGAAAAGPPCGRGGLGWVRAVAVCSVLCVRARVGVCARLPVGVPVCARVPWPVRARSALCCVHSHHPPSEPMSGPGWNFRASLPYPPGYQLGPRLAVICVSMLTWAYRALHAGLHYDLSGKSRARSAANPSPRDTTRSYPIASRMGFAFCARFPAAQCT